MDIATSTLAARSRRPVLAVAAAALASVGTLAVTSDAQAAHPPGLRACGPYANRPAAGGESRAERVTECLINNERRHYGRPRLKFHPRLASTAKAHTQDLVRNGFKDPGGHRGSNGSTEVSRLRWYGAGARWWMVRETVTENSNTSPAQAVRWWMGSPFGHRAVLLDGRLREFGVGMVAKSPKRNPGATYTANFGARVDARPPARRPRR